MNIIKYLSAGLALAGAMALPSLAAADEPTVHLNVHSGPGLNYRVIDVLSPGEHVGVTRRSGAWCYLNKAGQDGWAACRYLVSDHMSNGHWVRGDEGQASGPGSGNDNNGRPNVSIGFSIPGFSFHVGPGGFGYGRGPGNGRGPGRGHFGEVCFYQNHNYNGRSLCMRPGQSYARLHNWNDKISSVRIRGDAQAYVCQDWNYRGHCTTLNSDDRNLGNHDNKISSIRVTGTSSGPQRNAQVCFYQDFNFRGPSLCMRSGQDYSKLHTWNDRISSIRVSGGAQALVCEDWNYNGHCVTVDRDVRSLGKQGNDKISSIRVR